MNLSHKYFNEKISNNEHQSDTKRDKKNPSQTKYAKTQLKQSKQCNLCSKRDIQSREEKMKLLHLFNRKKAI